jgi:hypothetical protein
VPRSRKDQLRRCGTIAQMRPATSRSNPHEHGKSRFLLFDSASIPTSCAFGCDVRAGDSAARSAASCTAEECCSPRVQRALSFETALKPATQPAP